MRHALLSELRKLRTVRSTYVALILALLYVVFMSFYIEGYWGGSGSAAGAKTEFAYTEIIRNLAMGTWIFLVPIGILSVVHEYRYNTIMHSLTVANSRTNVLLAKLISIALFSLAFGLAVFGIGLAAYTLGANLRGGGLPPQTVDWPTALGTSLFYLFGYSMLGAMLGFLTRNIVAAILILLLGINLAETLLALLLKDNTVYLPMQALQQVISPGSLGDNILRPMQAALVFLAYLVIGWVVAWYLFLKRDAN